MNIERPLSDEFAPHYGTYINKVPEGNVIGLMEEQIGEHRNALENLDDAAALFRYAPGKWTVKEVLGHVIDSERVFCYRAMRIARSDPTPLPGFDENLFVANAAFNSLQMKDMLNEFEHLRRSNMYFFSSLSPETAALRGTANQLTISVRAIAYIVAGHATHHLGILQEKYLKRG